MKSTKPLADQTELIQQAIHLHRNGHLPEAAEIYHKVLKRLPNHPDVLTGLGTIALQHGDFSQAAFLLAKSIKIAPKQPNAYFNLGISYVRQFKFVEALNCYEQAIAIKPDYADAYNNLGNARKALGRFEDAISSYDRVIALKPHDAKAYNNRGTVLQELQELAQAELNYRQAIALSPDYAEAHYNLANILKDQKNWNEALLSFDKAISINQNYVDAHHNRGLVLLELEQIEAALDSFDLAIFIKPDYLNAYVIAGKTLQAQQKFQQAINYYNDVIALKPDDAEFYIHRAVCYHSLQHSRQSLNDINKAIELNPDDSEVYLHKGIVLSELKQFTEALDCFNHVLALNPQNHFAGNNRGNVLKDCHALYSEVYLHKGNVLLELRQFSTALECFDQVIALQPDHFFAYNNRGNALKELNRLDEAYCSYEFAIKLNPDYAETYCNCGNALNDMQRFDEARQHFQQAIALDQDCAGAYWNIALLDLLHGNFTEGWQLYEWRWRSVQKEFSNRFEQPVWLGAENLTDKSLLIYFEQGLGDFIQFCRFLPLLNSVAKHVIVETPKPLIKLLSSLPGKFEIMEQGQTLPDFDFQCPIMSLALAFKIDLNTLPATIPYLFADPVKAEYWQHRLGIKSKPRIGLVWSGSTVHKSDHNRSIPLGLFRPLWRLPVEIHALQKEINPADAELLANDASVFVHHQELQDFADTAALIAQMDLVISVDTSVAHLAGALGKPVWILLAYSCDYRWMLERSDSPWYPSAHLFRQQQPGDWVHVIANVVEKTAYLYDI
jgi:tetratricopeptide (TPR) repeat protein